MSTSQELHGPAPRAGAEGAAEYEKCAASETTATTKGDEPSNELPMVVWLTGSEPYCEDFSLDADAAMAALGIRRSRLTQISGRELRVGRIRIDRYIRPVYRQADIDDYRNWTRATATHQRSSSMIEDAAEKLENRATVIESKLQGAISELSSTVEARVRAIADETYALQTQGQQSIAASLNEATAKFETYTNNFATSVLAVIDELRDLLPGLTLEDLDTAFTCVREPIDSMQNQLEALTSFTNKLTAVLTPIEDLRDNIVSDLEEIAPALSEIYTMLFESAANTKEGLENQARFNRGIAEALGKVIECQRDATLKQQALLVEILQGQGRQAASSMKRLRRPPRSSRMMRNGSFRR